MYAGDYSEQVDNSVLESVIGKGQFNAVDSMMVDWFNDKKVLQSFMPYYMMVLSKSKGLA